MGEATLVLGADPAAGAEVSETVPAADQWRLLGVIVTLVTSATAANRRPSLSIDDGTNEVHRIRAGVDQLASLTRTYYFSEANDAEVDRSTTFLEMYEPLPEQLILPAGYRIRTVTQAIQVGDNYGAPKLFVVKMAPEERLKV